ncbi:MAG: hypothetical protein ACFHWX_09355 [Bacteroidota bacterium]
MKLFQHNVNRRSLVVLLLFLSHLFTINAQTPWSFKKFRKEVDDMIALPYSGKKLWLFKMSGLWGLYDEEGEQQLVPPEYQMVLPAVESTYFYIIRDNFVGFYVLNGGEILPPDQFKQLQVVIDSSGTYYLQNTTHVEKESGYYTTHTTEYQSFRLEQDEQKSWSLRQVSQNPFLRKNDKVKIKDEIEWIREDEWVHHYSYIKKADDTGSLLSPINYFEVADQQSGVISIEKKRYLIPPNYAEITWHDDYFKARSYTMINPINPLAYAVVESIFTTDFQLIESPPGGYVGLIRGDGYYTHDLDGTTVTLYDPVGKQLFTIEEFDGYPNEVLSIGERYYIACCPENMEEEEMRVFRQNIFSKDGQLLHKSKFRFERILENEELAIVSVINPTGDFDLMYGLYDLTENEFLINPEYEQLQRIRTRNSLLEVPNPDCDSYFIGNLNETVYLWDCTGKAFSGVVDYVSGETYDVDELEKSPESNSSSSEVTHIIEDPMNDFTMGDIGYYNATIEDSWRELTIYRCTHEYDDDKKVFFALGDKSTLILAPEFTSIRFHRANKTVELMYNDETYIFPVSRYEK